ncbi:hypothetical protein FOL47_007219 [Perkinsus chesapeaki]|uniref:Uncharacterized protein n=1 Tax=Perkinsus chesapeaki TaxID=330153 RepID=A0A7J6LLY2_PERCH|nr:hypothetical protein FOL47_007219 [Perkinsus chesapeaki]|mmetsp:Transcript_15024/g.12499  ORF Transcript_15024/g.12499 Transcript_15024/m.12499 type:complete len:201 (-) Transcript_15024:17-619(-)
MACYLPPPLHQSSTSSSSSSSSPTIATTDSTIDSIVSQSKIFQTLFGTSPQQQQQPWSADGETPRSFFPSNAVIVEATDCRPTKQPRLGCQAYCDDCDFDCLVESFLPLELSPEVIVPESPRLSCLDESLLDVPELLLPPVCEDTPHCAPRRIGLRRVVDRRRIVDGRRRRIRSVGLAEVRESERYLSGTKRRTREDDEC